MNLIVFFPSDLSQAVQAYLELAIVKNNLRPLENLVAIEHKKSRDFAISSVSRVSQFYSMVLTILGTHN